MTIPDSKSKTFLLTPLSSGFGANKEKALEDLVTGNTRFVYWLGGDKTKILQVLDTAEKNGLSWEYFAAKEIQEAYSAGLGWHNHTTPQGDYLQDAKYICDWTKQVAGGGFPLAYNDPYGGTTGIQSKAEADADYANIPTGTIGKAYLAMTAAAVWATWMPDYLATTPFGDPIAGCVALIEKWGGKVDGVNRTSSQTNTNTSNNSKANKSKNTAGGYFYRQNNYLWGKGTEKKKSESPKKNNPGSTSGGSFKEGDNSTPEGRVTNLAKAIKMKKPNATAEGIASVAGNFMQESNCIAKRYEADNFNDYQYDKCRQEPTAENLFGGWSGLSALYNIPLNEPYYNVGGKHFIGIGLGQFTGPRCKAIWEYCKSHNLDMLSFEGQISYLFEEPGLNEVLKKTLEMTDVNAACEYFMINWIGNTHGSANRYTYSQQYYNTVKEALK